MITNTQNGGRRSQNGGRIRSDDVDVWRPSRPREYENAQTVRSPAANLISLLVIFCIDCRSFETMKFFRLVSYKKK